MDWYEEAIEKPIRNLVRLLRDNGFNTECSCGHKMYVQCQYMSDGQIKRLDDLLFNNGYRDYTIAITIERKTGHAYTNIDIKIEPSL